MPAGREQRGDARDEVVDVRDLGEHVVSEDEIGRTALLRHPPAELRAEELRQCLDAARHRGLRHVQRRLDAEHRDAVREEVLEEVAVVGRDLDDEAVVPESQALDHVVRVATRVLDPGIGVGGEVRVLREDVLGRHELRDLDEPAFSTGARVEWVERLLLLELLGREHGLAERRLAEVDDGQLERRAAMTACRRPGYGRAVPEGCRLRSHSHLLHCVCDPARCRVPQPARRRQSTRPSRTQALWPPRPIAFESATSTSTRRASFGT